MAGPERVLAACSRATGAGRSSTTRRSTEVVGDALWLTLLVNFAVVIFIHLVAIPIAIYSATRQYSVGDYVATFIGYIGLATPSFLLALILLYYVEPLVRHLDRRALRSAIRRRAVGLGQDPVARCRTSSFRPSSSASAARPR